MLKLGLQLMLTQTQTNHIFFSEAHKSGSSFGTDDSVITIHYKSNLKTTTIMYKTA